MSACILPIAPDFQDPSAAPNYPPYIMTTAPVQGSVVTSTMFSVTVADPNAGDDLYVRWEADYPPVSPNSRALNGNGTKYPAPTNSPSIAVQMTVDCNSQLLATTLVQHQIMVIIADREFATGAELDKAKDGGNVVRASWTLNLDCAAPQ